MAEHDGGRRAGLVVFSSERSPTLRRHAEQIEVVPGDKLAHDDLAPPLSLDAVEATLVVNHAAEDRGGSRTDVVYVGVRGGRWDLVGALRIDLDELLGRLHRERPKQDRVHDAEDRAVRSDPQPYRQKGDDRESGTRQQPAAGVFQIGDEGFHRALPGEADPSEFAHQGPDGSQRAMVSEHRLMVDG